MTTISDDGFVDNLINPIPITDPPIIIPGPTTTVPAPTNLQASAVAGKVTLT